MSTVFKKQVVRYYTPAGRQCRKSDPGAAAATEQLANWYGTVEGVAVPLCTDRQAAERMLRKLQSDAALVGVGLADPFAAHKRTPLADHLTAYREHLTAKGNTADHCKQTCDRIAAMFARCGFVLPTDLDAGRASEWLNAIRTGTRAVVVPPGDSFTPAQVAALFGVSGAAVRATLKRLGMTGTGHGKARRYQRATVVAMADRTGQGVGPETVNHYVRAVRGFVRWMVKSKRIGTNPLHTLTLVNARSDVRRGRVARQFGK